MNTLDKVRNQLEIGEFDFSRHALRRAVERNVSEAEIMEAGRAAIIIEEYPDDKYSPSCLLLGYTQAGRPLHLQVSLAERPLVKIVALCDVCGSTEGSSGYVSEVFKVEGKQILVKKIPATGCKRCGDGSLSRPLLPNAADGRVPHSPALSQRATTEAPTKR